MKKLSTENNVSVPLLIPFEPEDFWAQIREIVREELSKSQKYPAAISNIMETPGLTQKPLYKIEEICTLFKVSRPTIYDWIKHGKLRRLKIRSRVYFLGADIQKLIDPLCTLK